MKLIDLVDLAFQRGTYTSLAQVRASRRFAELVRTYRAEPDPEMAATLHLLGDSLIEAAWRTLPLSTRQMANAWQTAGAEGQLLLLAMFHDDIRQVQRDNEPPRVRTRRQTAAENLPLEHGRLGKGPIRPSCVGLGSLLMAFAQRTGAPHYYAHVIFTNAKALQELYCKLIRGVQDELREKLGGLHEAGELSMLDRAMDAVLYNLGEIDRYNFHPSLVIQLCDGRWVLVDPNLGVRSILREDDWPVGDDSHWPKDARFGSVVNMSSIAALDRLGEQWAREWGRIGNLLHVSIEQFLDPPSPESLYRVAAFVIAVAERYPELWVPILNGWDSFDLIGDSLFPEGSRHTKHEYDAAIMRLRGDAEYAKLCSERVIRYLYQRWLHLKWKELRYCERNTPHVTIELARPAAGVATTVLENLRCFVGRRPLKLNGAMTSISASQMVWYHTRYDLHDRAAVPAEVAALWSDREQVLRSMPRRQAHPFVFRLLAGTSPEVEGETHNAQAEVG